MSRQIAERIEAGQDWKRVLREELERTGMIVIAEIAESTGRGFSTVAGHCKKLVKEGRAHWMMAGGARTGLRRIQQ